MADVEEIRAYVESHPDDHKQRWRLAKKLYNAWDYRSALEHLLLLREIWPDQVPVMRYLAATYYRLGKYEEAAGVLQTAIEAHPEDASLVEQLAKVYEGGGQTDKAIEAWNRVREIKPTSNKAEEALERLGMAMGTMASTMAGDTQQEMSDHGDDTLIICPHCGANNDVFSHRCSRCHGDFGERGHAYPEEAAPRVSAAAGLIFVLSFVVIAGLSVAIFYWIAYAN